MFVILPTMELSFYTVDAFTPHPFSGNPAAVCPLEDDISDNVKQSIATEMNISETCFITKVINDQDVKCVIMNSVSQICVRRRERVSRIAKSLDCAGSPRPMRCRCADTPPWPRPPCSSG